VHPALAESWTRSSDGRTWTFTLAGDRTGLNKKALDAYTVADWWTADSGRDARSRDGGVLAVTATGSRTLDVRLRAATDSIPLVLADPAFAVARARPRHAVLALSQMLFDPRDAIALGADVILTDDREAIAYAAHADSFVAVPLPWSRTIAVVLSSADSELVPKLDAAQFRQGLAHDVVHVDAQPSQGTNWAHLSCNDQATGAAAERPASARVGYALGDQPARDIAGRLVALGFFGARASVVALSPQELASSMRNGRERAYVVSLPASLVPCADRPPWPADTRVVPLIDTRYQAILSPRAPALTVDWDGTLRLAERVAADSIVPVRER